MSSLSPIEEFLRQRLLTLRKVSGLTQEGFAEVSELSVIYIQSIERGIRPNPSLKILDKISKTYGLTISQLLGEKVPEIRLRSLPNPPPHKRKKIPPSPRKPKGG